MNMIFVLTRSFLRLINLIWYLLLSPLFIVYLLVHASGLKQYILAGYQSIPDLVDILLGKGTHLTSTNSIATNKQGLDRAAGSGIFPLTVCLGLFYNPFYIYTMIYWNVNDFLCWNIPLMFVFGLICSEDTHYDSHNWLTRRYQSVWYKRLISLRFKQYTQMIWYPLTQHMPHLYIHHKFNMKDEQDIDYVGSYQRDGLGGFLAFLSIYDWNYNCSSLRYFYELPSKTLLRLYVKDMLLNYGLLLFAMLCAWQKFLFQYACHSLCYTFIAWTTFYIEHPFHHPIKDSYEHYWNVLTLVDSTTGLCTESHTSHHIWPARSMEENASWANNAIEFSKSQLENRHLAIHCTGAFQELLYLPYLIITKQYSKLANMLHFKSVQQLEKDHMQSDLIQAYQHFQAECDANEIKRRLQSR